MRAASRSRPQGAGEGEVALRVTPSSGALTGAGGANGCGGARAGVGSELGANLGKLAVGAAE
jgi:hypothetical protein